VAGGIVGMGSGAGMSTGRKIALFGGINAAGFAGVNAYANERDASQVNMYLAGMGGSLGGMGAVAFNRMRQGHSLFTRPGQVNNKLFPGGGHQSSV